MSDITTLKICGVLFKISKSDCSFKDVPFPVGDVYIPVYENGYKSDLGLITRRNTGVWHLAWIRDNSWNILGSGREHISWLTTVRPSPVHHMTLYDKIHLDRQRAERD